jgi:hypothetical protein
VNAGAAVGTPVVPGIFMNFLCRGPSSPLEDLWDKCHLFGRPCGFPDLVRLNALTCKPTQGSPGVLRRAQRVPEGCEMLDVVMLAIGLGFFALSVGYTIVCDRL